jgi:DNA replication protein DnaC
MLATLEIRVNEALSNHLNHEEFLELIIQDEMNIRNDRAIERRIFAAKFRDQKRIEDFDFHFNKTINKNQIMSLASCEFVKKAQDILFIGPPGVGKSHLAEALGAQAARLGYSVLYRSIFDAVSDLIQAESLNEKNKILNRYLKPELLIVDDMGLKKLPKTAGEHLFEIIMRRYELKSTIMTSNRPIEEWGNLIGDVPTATAILDRFLSRAEIIQIKGNSYRLKDKACKNNK